MSSNPYGNVGMSASVGDLGFGLKQQVKDETDEERRKRLMGLSAMQSPAAQMLLGQGAPAGGR